MSTSLRDVVPADGRTYLDRLAALHQLLALRRADDDPAANRRVTWHRLLGWRAPASSALAPAPAGFERHPPPRR